MSSSSELWSKETEIPLYYFSHPLKFSKTEFIVCHSAKFRGCPFQILKYNVSTKKWHKFQIKAQDDPSPLLNTLDYLEIGIQSTSPDSRIMECHGIHNVTLDLKKKRFYAINFKWDILEIDLLKSPLSITKFSCPKEIIHNHGPNTPFKSYLFNPYLNMINDCVYILTPNDTRRKIFIPGNNLFQGDVSLFIFKSLFIYNLFLHNARNSKERMDVKRTI